jgi:transketolase
MNKEALSRAAAEARGLAIDAVHACSSGHLGLPLGCADMGAVLFGEALRFNPASPKWLNRDRFILSAGHGSMFIYTWLHLAGYNVSGQDVADFRKLHSITPGHPEFDETEGVEATTGPLGQGVGNAVGYALSGKRAAGRYNTAEHTIFDHKVVALAGDGCLQEGVAQESIAFAGHNQLDNLILIYDSNDVTLDAMAEVTQGWDSAKYFESLGWNAVTIDGHDMEAFLDAFNAAKASSGKPSVIIAKTLIGKGIPQVSGTASAHGESGANFAQEARKELGLPAQSFFVSDETKAYFAAQTEAKGDAFNEWQGTYDAWAAANQDLASELEDSVAKVVPTDLSDKIPAFADDYADATRGSGGVVINAVAKAMPSVITGSADLYGSTKNYLKEQGDFSATNPTGRNIWFGIREHGMGAICNGIAYDGLFRISGATFCVFADYLRPAIRLAGFDGPTALILSRQKVMSLNDYASVQTRRDGVAKGAYILKKEEGELECIILATGSEVEHAINAAKEIGAGARVVSAPCLERFDRQSDSYKEEVLPASCTKRAAIEAGVTGLWYKYVGLDGTVVGIDRFGISAPGNVVMDELGINAANLVKALS